MVLVQEEKFKRKDYEKTSEVISLKLNPEERELLNKCKLVLEQEKDGTAIKQMVYVGAKVILEDKISYILGTIFANKRKNKRLGIAEFD